MKKFAFDHSRKSWDRYNAFHYQDGAMTFFEDGSAMVTRHPDPDRRVLHNNCAVQLVATSDDSLPELFLDGEPVKRAWLTHGGMQQLAVDWERGKAYRLSNTSWGAHQAITGIPEHAQRCCLLYWAGAGQEPLRSTHIEVSKPDRVNNSKLKKLLAGIRAAVTAAYKMTTEAQTNHWYYTSPAPVAPDINWLGMTETEVVRIITKDPELTSLVARYGFGTFRDVQKVPYLEVKNGSY